MLFQLHIWRLSIKNLYLHPVRSMLTVLGIFIGVASVVWLLAISEGISREAQRQIEELVGQSGCQGHGYAGFDIQGQDRAFLPGIHGRRSSPSQRRRHCLPGRRPMVDRDSHRANNG